MWTAAVSSPLIHDLFKSMASQVEFYASKMIPGDKITTIARTTQIEEAIQIVLATSNFQGNKPAMLRDLALYGDQFIRVRGEEDKVMLENIKPRYVTDFTEDSRGFLQEIRIVVDPGIWTVF